MTINGKDVICFKVFVSEKIFLCRIFNSESKHEKVFEISEETENTEEYIIDVIKKIIECFSYKEFLFCGYNNVHYDNAFINMIFSKFKFYQMAGVNNEYILKEFNTLNSYIINNDYEKWKEFKYGKNFSSFDLMMMNFSKKERISLAEVKFSLNMKTVLSAHHMCTNSGYKAALDNDVEAITKLLERSEDIINLRLDISEQYNIGTLSLDDVSLGKKIFSLIFAKETGKSMHEYPKKDIPKIIEIKDLILPDIRYTSLVLNTFLDKLKQLTISIDNPNLEERFTVFGSNLSFGLGGLHSIDSPRIIKPDTWKTIVHVDGESMYPSMVLNYNLFPEFLGKEFISTYKKMLEMRIEAKNNGNEAMDKMLKRILVAMVGMFNNPNDPMYDPVCFYKITINCQLLLLLLAEKLYFGATTTFINWNTDGLFIEINKFSNEQVKCILQTFESNFKIKFVPKYYSTMYQIDGNNYFALSDMWEKRKSENIKDFSKLITCKGIFKEPYKSLKATNGGIIAKAVISNLLFGKPVEEVINDAIDNNKYLFMYFSKIPSSYIAFYGDVNIGNVNRYYYSKGGFVITKKNIETGAVTLVSDKGCPVTIANVDTDMKNIDKQYYINKAYLIINQIRFVQLKLF